MPVFRRRRLVAPALILLALCAGGAVLISGRLTSHAVQNPTISFDMVTSGTTYEDLGNSMDVGTVDNCLTSATANPNTHTHAAHLVIQNVEDLIGWQARLNYFGDRMRPNTVNFAPFVDNTTMQAISFVNLPIDQDVFVHRDLITASNIPPAGAGAQTASMGASYGGAQDFAISPDTPEKTPQDDISYNAHTGGVLAAIALQVVGNQTGNQLFVNLDDGSPNGPGSGIQYFDGTGGHDVLLPSSALGDGFHGEGVTCAPQDCTNTECPPVTTPPPTPPPCGSSTDCDGDGVPNASDNCPSWPNPSQNLPPWFVPADDPDCDGFSTSMENAIGTNPNAHCGVSAWPPDLNNDTFITIIGDIVQLTGNFAKSVPPAPARQNMAPEPPDTYIDIFDITRGLGFRLGQSCAS
jgi:hypothetical protein